MNLGDLLDATDPADLLPARRTEEATRVVPPWAVLADIDLGPTWSGAPARYLVLADDRGVRFGVPAVIAAAGLRRAVPGDGVSEALVAAVSRGSLEGMQIETFGDVDAELDEAGIEVDQTNELVVVGDRLVVKWFLHPDDAQPAPQRLAALARAGYDGTPRLRGLVRTAGSVVAMIVDYLPDTLDGWDWAVTDVRSLARGEIEQAAALGPVRVLATLIAEMHIALAAAGISLATDAVARSWSDAARSDVDAAPIPEDLAIRSSEIVDALAYSAGTPLIATHGDLHIGQILRSAAGRYYVIDFDGSPMLAPHDRLLHQPAARDVAGMVASLDHVGRVVLHRTEHLGAADQGRVLDWIEAAQEEFLVEYRSALESAGVSDLLDERLIAPFQVQQECREYAYAARYLPHWRYVPDAALPALLARESS